MKTLIETNRLHNMKSNHNGCLIAIALLGLVIAPHAQAAPGDVDLSFDPGSGIQGGTVNSIVVQPDGKVLLGGGFVIVKGAVRKGIARLNADGTLDTSFNPGSGANSEVMSVVREPDGKVLIAGAFTSVNATARNGIARLNSDGSVDASFDPGSGAIFSVRSIVREPDGKVLIAGTFTSVNGTARNGIARLNSDGSVDTSFDHGIGVAGGVVLSVALQPDGKVIIGGDFTAFNGQTRYHIARLNADGSLDTGFNPLVDAWVRSVSVQPDGKVLMGGLFGSVNETSRSGIARLNANGSLDISFDPGSGVNYFSEVMSIATLPDGKMFIGGNFQSFNGIPRNSIARLNADGSLDTSFDPGSGVTTAVSAIAVQTDGLVLVSGGFASVNGAVWSGIARLNADGSLDSSFDPGTGGVDYFVQSVAIQADGKVIIGGWFGSVGGARRVGVARMNSDGSLDTSFVPDTDPMEPVWSLAVQADGKILIGGQFDSVGGVARKNIARLNENGSLDTSFDLGTGIGEVSFPWLYSVVLQPDGKVLIGGTFASVNGTARNRIARVNSNGSLDASFDPGSGANLSVLSVALQSDGKVLIGGAFTSVNETTRRGIARLNNDGSLDASFDPGTVVGTGGVVALAATQSDGKVLIGGPFRTVSGAVTNRIVRLNSNGSLDTGFNPGTGADAAIYSMALQPDGKVLIGGGFSSVNGTARNGIARLNADGNLDISFNPGTGTDRRVQSLAVQPDGKVLLGGEFLTVNGIARTYVTRLHTDYLPSRLELGAAGSLPALHLTGDVGQQYVLEYASELTGSNGWTALPAFTLTNSPQTVVDDTAANEPQRFYRARRIAP